MDGWLFYKRNCSSFSFIKHWCCYMLRLLVDYSYYPLTYVHINDVQTISKISNNTNTEAIQICTIAHYFRVYQSIVHISLKGCFYMKIGRK